MKGAAIERFLHALSNDGHVRRDVLFPALLQCRTLNHFEDWLKYGLIPLFRAQSGLVYQSGDPEGSVNFLCRVNVSSEADGMNVELIRRDPLEKVLGSAFSTRGRCVVAYDVDLPRTKLHEITNRIWEEQGRPISVGKFGSPVTLLVAYLYDDPPLRLRIQRTALRASCFRREDLLLMQSFACQCGLCLRSLMLGEELRRYKSLASHLTDTLPAAAFVAQDGTILMQNSTFEAMTRATGSLPLVLMEALNEPEKETLELEGHRFWFKCHWLAGGCRLILLDRRSDGIPVWQRVRWPSQLSHREREICRLVLEGLENEVIAERLHLSYHTIKNHCRHIHEKVGVTSRVELVLALLGLAPG